MAEVAAIAFPPVIKVVALCGSLRKGSFNRGLLRADKYCIFFFMLVGLLDYDACLESIGGLAVEMAKSIKGLEIEYVDISPLPILNTDLEVNGTYPLAVEDFRLKIRAADSILFASPEYNYSVSGTKT
ncbi:hypothetical protein OROHE_005476 [Orobanche hederae]